ncbi:hypothetical protein FD754_005588 [Muntiacus muntjak]|uniref:Uncharacterized protein n=1 Tax=Muntiacus muntjak TaxID=9888 RepID=A0A5N3WI24_MUNMU|nr:hypothetical protein FD754_005588 [Muntiacus muntjak]
MAPIPKTVGLIKLGFPLRPGCPLGVAAVSKHCRVFGEGQDQIWEHREAILPTASRLSQKATSPEVNSSSLQIHCVKKDKARRNFLEGSKSQARLSSASEQGEVGLSNSLITDVDGSPPSSSGHPTRGPCSKEEERASFLPFTDIRHPCPSFTFLSADKTHWIYLLIVPLCLWLSARLEIAHREKGLSQEPQGRSLGLQEKMNQEEGSTPKEESPRQSHKAEVRWLSPGLLAAALQQSQELAKLGTSFAQNGFYCKAMVLLFGNCSFCNEQLGQRVLALTDARGSGVFWRLRGGSQPDPAQDQRRGIPGLPPSTEFLHPFFHVELGPLSLFSCSCPGSTAPGAPGLLSPPLHYPQSESLWSLPQTQSRRLSPLHLQDSSKGWGILELGPQHLPHTR